MSESLVRVVKVGGSLFDLPELGPRLEAWLAAQPPASNFLIAGGGDLAESIRQLDALHHIGEIPAHLLCIRAMGVTARLLLDLLHETALIDNLAAARELIAARPHKNAVFDPAPMLNTIEPTLGPASLPQGWLVTSDSIAARVAEVLSAHELVLLKSSLPDSESCEAASRSGYVDEYFPSMAARLSLSNTAIRCVNLRNEAFEEVLLSAEPQR